MVKLLVASLVSILGFSPAMMTHAMATPAVDGIYAKLCNSSRRVFIPLPNGKKDQEAPLRVNMACHAICDERVVAVKSKKKTLPNPL